MFPVYGGKCLLHEAVHKWVKRCGTCLAGDVEFEVGVQKSLRQQSKDFHAAGFDTLVK
jgi:hypothetical protein